jgi:murein DD-endopeptidase MepM/ murein hydrolase activator NlpD
MGSLPRPKSRRLAVALTAVSAALLFLGARQPRAAANCDPDLGAAGIQRLSSRLVAASPGGGASCLAPISDTVAQDESPPAFSPISLPAALGLALAGIPASSGSSGASSDTLPLALRLALPAAVASASNKFIWPVSGPITQPFGVPELGVGPPHTGIDIGQAAGSPVRAALAGRVTFAGGDPCCGLGYWIAINHGNRFATVYAHFMRPPLLLAGDYVNQGQIVGFSGSTGFSTGPHLHFEVRLDGTPVDPLRVLPSR